METLRELIRQVDDDYLIGLSNKGTVKRACKDLEQETPALIWQGEEAQVALREETCIIRAPLGESKCSCPSRTICRHVVTAILWMRRELKANTSSDIEEPDKEKTDAAPEEPAPKSDASGQKKAVVLEEVLQLPAEKLKRACGSRKMRTFLNHIKAGELPPMEESSVVTVKLPWENAVVKLLEPFAYTTCSCHSQDLCAHKAQAALFYQLAKGRITLADLEQMQKEEIQWDLELVSKSCQSVCESLCRQISTGLSRQSSETPEELERLAVICHRAGLPALESGLREILGEYQQYFARSAAFRQEELLRKLLGLYERAKSLVEAKDQERIRSLAGTFRDTYETTGKLWLVGMGGRSFSSKTGYEGEIYYFLEKKQKRWYTWTDARPVYYEGTGRRPPARSGQAPWGLPCSREQMQETELELTGAKAAPGGRLSASQETKGEIIRERDMEDEDIRQMIVWDYETLLSGYFSPTGTDGNLAQARQERLALVGAVRWGETDFDMVRQRFSWSLYDQKGRKIFISLKYTKEERLMVNLLERLERRLRDKEPGAILFFGSVYMDEQGRLCLYPIEFYRGSGIHGPEMRAEDQEPEKRDSDTWPAEIVETFSGFCREVKGQLLDLHSSGLYSVWEEGISRMALMGEEAERLGLHGAGKELSCIAKILEQKRHQMEFSPKPAVEAMGRLVRYLAVCEEKTALDRALLAMREPSEERN